MSRGDAWAVIVAALLVLVPVLYVLSSGPAHKLTIDNPERSMQFDRAYRRVFAGAEALGLDRLFQRYLDWWCPPIVFELNDDWDPYQPRGDAGT